MYNYNYFILNYLNGINNLGSCYELLTNFKNWPAFENLNSLQAAQAHCEKIKAYWKYGEILIDIATNSRNKGTKDTTEIAWNQRNSEAIRSYLKFSKISKHEKRFRKTRSAFQLNFGNFIWRMGQHFPVGRSLQLFRNSGTFRTTLRDNPNSRNLFPGSFCTIRFLTRFFRSIWSNGKTSPTQFLE